MFCIHCGKEIENDSRFCIFCGGTQPVSENEPVRTTMGTKDSGDKEKKDWKEYLTLENMELAAVIALLLPVFSAVTNLALYILNTILSFVPFMRTPMKVILLAVGVVFVIATGVGLTACIYLIANKPEKRNVWGYITLGGTALAFIACIGILIPGRVKSIALVIAVISFIWGLDAFSRVVLQKKGMESEANVGNDLDSYSRWYKDYKAAHPSVGENEEKKILNDPEASYFDGSGTTLLGITILTIIVSGITCGIAAPWMICMQYKWRKEHTVINGKRLNFTGTGGSLLGHWLLWMLLCVITCGIYSFFMHVALKKWELEHTEYAGQPNVIGQFDGDSFEYFGYGLLQAILILLTCGLAAPWTITLIQKWEMRHSIVAGDRMVYEGTALGILGQYIVVFLLSLITCGIYAPWGAVRLNKYVYGHTRVYR